ncbi:MAG: DUF6174 domain-containing protein [Bacteroidota bacterium]
MTHASRRGSLWLIACLLPVLLGGCSLLDLDRDVTPDTSDRDRWEDQDLSDYRYTLSIQCFCIPLGDLHITVRADTVAAVDVNLDLTGQGYSPADSMAFVERSRGNARTIDDVFDQIHEARVRGAHRVNVSYDAERRYPTDVYLDYEENIADDELGLTLRDLVPLTP